MNVNDEKEKHPEWCRLLLLAIKPARPDSREAARPMPPVHQNIFVATLMTNTRSVLLV
jgi:hypothetical protein